MPNSIRITIDPSDLQQLPENIKAKLAEFQDKGMRGGGLRSTIQTIAEKEYASIGSNLRYARIHQLGVGSVRPGYPARPYLGMDERGKKRLSAN